MFLLKELKIMRGQFLLSWTVPDDKDSDAVRRYEIFKPVTQGSLLRISFVITGFRVGVGARGGREKRGGGGLLACVQQ